MIRMSLTRSQSLEMRRRWRRIALPLGAVALSLAGPERTAVLFPSSAHGSDPHTYSFYLKPGWLLHLSLEQQGPDVMARVLAPDGRELFRVDSPTGDKGSEEVWLVADSAGVHHVVVEPWAGSKGRYKARLRALRPATDEDRANAAAERAYHLAYQGEGSAPRAWLEGMYLRAALAWESLGRTDREADARFRLGEVRAESETGGERWRRNAGRATSFTSSAPGSPRCSALDRIAEAHQALGELEEARRVLQEALLRWRLWGNSERGRHLLPALPARPSRRPRLGGPAVLRARPAGLAEARRPA